MMEIFMQAFTWCQNHWLLVALISFVAFQKYSASLNAKAMENIPGSLVQKIVSDAQWNEASKAAEGKIVLVDFYAVWCGPCVRAAPIFAALSQELSKQNIELWKVDVDGPHTISKKQRISCMPTFKFYRAENGTLVELETIQGWSETQVRSGVNKYISK
jgi:thiol-disulfide isomerase/thioredoxin